MKRSLWMVLVPFLLSACSMVPIEKRLPENIQRRIQRMDAKEVRVQQEEKSEKVVVSATQKRNKTSVRPVLEKKDWVSYKRVCILPPKGDGQDPVTQAMFRGARQSTDRVEVLKEGDGTQACPVVLAWKAYTQGTRVNAIMVVPFVYGVPGQSVRIVPPQQQKGLTTQIIELNTAGYLRYLQRHAIERRQKDSRKTP